MLCSVHGLWPYQFAIAYKSDVTNVVAGLLISGQRGLPDDDTYTIWSIDARYTSARSFETEKTFSETLQTISLPPSPMRSPCWRPTPIMNVQVMLLSARSIGRPSTVIRLEVMKFAPTNKTGTPYIENPANQTECGGVIKITRLRLRLVEFIQ